MPEIAELLSCHQLDPVPKWLRWKAGLISDIFDGWNSHLTTVFGCKSDGDLEENPGLYFK